MFEIAGVSAGIGSSGRGIVGYGVRGEEEREHRAYAIDCAWQTGFGEDGNNIFAKRVSHFFEAVIRFLDF